LGTIPWHEPIDFDLACFDEPFPYEGCKLFDRLSEGSDWSAKWVGTLIVPVNGDYMFRLEGHDDGARIILDGSEIIDMGWRYPDPDLRPSPQVVNISAGAHDVIIDYEQRFLGAAVLQVRWSGPGFGEEVIPIMSEGPHVQELRLVGLEVTQGIQNWNNEVELIKDRPTFVRAHVKGVGGTVLDVEARLIGRRNGVELPDSPLENVMIDVLENPDRRRPEQSFAFFLPETWRSGTVELEFQGVSHPIVCRQHADIDDDCKVNVTFTESPGINAMLIGVIWEEGGIEHKPSPPDIDAAAFELFVTMPVPGINYQYRNIDRSDFGVVSGTVSWNLLLHRLYGLRIQDGNLGEPTYYVGVLIGRPNNLELEWAGMGNRAEILGDFTGAGYLRGLTISHEVGHIAGRDHVRCSGTEVGPIDSDYRPLTGWISADQDGDNAFYGLNMGNLQIYARDNSNGTYTGDLMSYCSPRWLSKHTYEGIRGTLVTDFGSTSSASSLLLTEDPAVLISGIVTPTVGTGSLESVFTLNAPSSIPTPDSGSYTIRFEDHAGQELASYDFEPAFGVPANAPTNADALSVGTFALLLPWDQNTNRIVLLHDTQELDSHLASSNAPSVELTYPNGGESLSGSATVSWSASDLDGDPLEYVLQYSPDAGSSWLTLATDWPSTTYELDLEMLPGTDQGLMRVFASDGFHTAQDQSDAIFSVAKHPPRAYIWRPETDSLYYGEQMIILEGLAQDNEDGTLTDTAFSWSSDLDGALGAGNSLAIRASALTEGNHTITLAAQDSDGQTGTDIISIQVFREKPELPPSLAVAPTAMTFMSELGGTQIAGELLSIWNSGDGAMSWSAIADQTWIRISSLEGSAPTNILVAADPTGLPPGEYTGTITISAPGVANSPQVVEVTLEITSNQPPVADAGGPYNVNEGGSIIVTATGSDPEGASLAYAWDLDNDGSFETPGQSATFSAAGLDGPSSHTIAVQVTDSGGLTATDPATVNILNVAPTVDAINVPLKPAPVNKAINTSVNFTDPGTLDTHTAVWDWGDGTTSAGVVSESNGSGFVSGEHTYDAAGVYMVKVTVTDDDGGVGESIFQYVITSFVDIDIIPHSKQNRIHFHRKRGPIGLIQVTILSTSDFDAPSVVDRTSLTFGHTGDQESLKSCFDHAKDVNHDGLKDLVCVFQSSLTGFQPGDTEGILKGKTVDGTLIEGSDSVKIVITGEHDEEEDD